MSSWRRKSPTVTLGADAAEIDDGGAMAAHLKTVLPRLNEARAKRLLSGKARYVTLMSGLTPAQKQDVLAFGDPALKLREATSRVYPAGEVTAHTGRFRQFRFTRPVGAGALSRSSARRGRCRADFQNQS
jgi:hypothetical protein